MAGMRPTQRPKPSKRRFPWGPAVAVVIMFLAIATVVKKGDANTVRLTAARRSTTTTRPRHASKRGAGRPFTLTWVGDMVIGSTATVTTTTSTTTTITAATTKGLSQSSPSTGSVPNSVPGIFDTVRPLLASDLPMGNLEGPLVTTTPLDKCPNQTVSCLASSQNPEYAQVYKSAGFKVLSLANNHVPDRGDQGVQSTAQALDKAGLSFAGIPGRQPVIQTVNGTDVAVLAFDETANPGGDVKTVTDQVRAAKANADVVVVLFHGGTEGDSMADMGKDQSSIGVTGFAHAAVDAGAATVLGSGPRVLRGIEFYKGHPIAYSLGNFALYGQGHGKRTAAQTRSAVIAATLGPDGTFVSGSLRPVTLTTAGVPAPGGDAVAVVANLSKKDFGSESAGFDPKTGAVTPPA